MPFSLPRRASSWPGAAAGAGRDAAKPWEEDAGEEDACTMAAEIKDAKKQLALYDHRNMTDVRLYNAARAEYRRDNGTYDSDRKPERKAAGMLHACGN